MSTLYLDAVLRRNTLRPPVWFMRQAGRYHSHYQGLKRKHGFMELCKVPALAAETTFGPIRDFDFDAAILFSDLLFPLEILGMGLEYSPGPKLGWHLRDRTDLERLNPSRKSPQELVQEISYQGEALSLIRKGLPAEKAILGFVGGPLTLFYYAVEGSHQGSLESAKSGLTDGRFEGFFRILAPFLVENMSLQARSGADAVAVMDTCAGDVEPSLYREIVVPTLREVLTQFRTRHPETRVVYYSKGTAPSHWQHLEGLPFECLGIDWHTDIAGVLTSFGSRWSIQGNFDPNLMVLPEVECMREIEKFFAPVLKLPRAALKGWVCGLGHGVLQTTPEQNVRNFLRYQREIFA
ncbi:uroporphyrinogen decarboxylase [bacterium]|nr:uroporphyrinogen decarboxylase [bacterium]